jgi:hypothetical protein
MIRRNKTFNLSPKKNTKNGRSMAGGLKLLKKGFVALEKHVSECKTAIQDRLKKSQRIDDDNTAWLDGPANLVDEQQALDALENASDYEQGGLPPQPGAPSCSAAHEGICGGCEDLGQHIKSTWRKKKKCALTVKSLSPQT